MYIIFHELDRALAHAAAELARTHRLRGADAVYAAVALQHGATLVSRDREHLNRLASIVPVLHPSAALMGLTTS
ncbi:MAG: PIN domain-containing protein [Roseiflexaceae bacterium]|nr:PIN domain-containing protein [Roseiflexaceae bacterium]